MLAGKTALPPSMLPGALLFHRPSTPWALQWSEPDQSLQYLMHARYYGSSIGRFLRPDPINGNPANPQSWNLYAYVQNNPVNFNDPTGMLLIRLGQHTEDQIKEGLADVKQQLKNKDLTKEQRAALKEQKKTLQLESEGNQIVGDMLAKLDEVGERNGLTLQNFTLSTDLRADFPDASKSDYETMSQFDAMTFDPSSKYAGTTYIRTDMPGGFYQMSRRSSDWGYYGASALSHEQVHLRGFGGQLGEFFAYSRQHMVYGKFQNNFNSIELYRWLDEFLNKKIAKYF